jgi:hypothetical protein
VVVLTLLEQQYCCPRIIREHYRETRFEDPALRLMAGSSFSSPRVIVNAQELNYSSTLGHLHLENLSRRPGGRRSISYPWVGVGVSERYFRTMIWGQVSETMNNGPVSGLSTYRSAT